MTRALIRAAGGDFDRAIADLNDAIRLDPGAVRAYIARALVYRLKGDRVLAINDLNDAIRLDPKNAFAYRTRGLAYLYGGNLAKALADVSEVSALDPKDAYGALWVDIVGQRNDVPIRLARAISNIDMTLRPAPVIRRFLGQMTPAAVLAASDDPDAVKKSGQVCEANFYGGELALRRGAKDEATPLFRRAARRLERAGRRCVKLSGRLLAAGDALSPAATRPIPSRHSSFPLPALNGPTLPPSPLPAVAFRAIGARGIWH
jgi:lipoprotein NlpI